ncbi:MAG TPA: YHS domain-containing protein [Ideonella sp.]|uniref:YHS domain-containing protein n=1 Tax=Ideonella sp. TaxID=1929293 RepID=UPI002E2F611F|nr:YHS domain-containing protein [Ideonella sp.]HEX5683203.1 YHS domain-containing protein [Ideonella sp.]
MDWLTQNWGYLLMLVAVIVFMRFGGMGCGIGGRRARSPHGTTQRGGEDVPGGLPSEPSPSTDPVSQRMVDPATAVATVYQGRAYYFESRENRDRFEAAPQAYAGPKPAAHGERRHKHHGGGCC